MTTVTPTMLHRGTPAQPTVDPEVRTLLANRADVAKAFLHTELGEWLARELIPTVQTPGVAPPSRDLAPGELMLYRAGQYSVLQFLNSLPQLVAQIPVEEPSNG